MTPLVRIVGLRKSFGAIEVLKGVDLEVARGECVSIVGPNGSGKTTLLRCVNFLERPTGGEVRYGGAALGYSGAALKEHRRQVQLVLQDPARR